ncbi:hypothetical protein [Streptomyces colonosanans]|uniref:Uncharacterized protein n=1 Tax=Streptomyces colonosanans TaxID=1428652 RepID=A0A1S2PNM2_9ACTN|nr:hypothetical protein [Streptomyces colonosanans]OIJ95408.1 hypothetical protein BIV24_08995 [Streptomyces colonosanans]
MIELLVLAAIAYAGARGVESLAGTSDRRHDTREVRKTVEKIAASGPKSGGVKKPPGPAEPGGTFSAAAPRSAAVGGRAAVPFAVITETGSTMWKATVEGYRERWPEIRAERRKKMAEKAAAKKTEREAAEAKRKADEALAKAGPAPAHPPMPTEPPKTDDAPRTDTPDEEPDPLAKVPAPRSPDAERADAAEERAAEAEKKAEEARKEAEEAKERAARDKVLAAQKEAREAKEREAAAAERARAAEERAAADKTTTPEPPDGRRHLTVVPDPEQNGDLMSSPSSVIPEIRTLDGLMNALTLTKAMCEMRAEEAAAIAADDGALSNRLDQLEAELAEMEVDDATIGEINALRESIKTQSQSAAQYGSAAKDAGDFATAAAAAAYKSHGGIAEAVQSSPVEKAAQGGYYER